MKGVGAMPDAAAFKPRCVSIDPELDARLTLEVFRNQYHALKALGENAPELLLALAYDGGGTHSTEGQAAPTWISWWCR
jgi:hypothetical protein